MAKQDEIQTFSGYYSGSKNLIGCSKTNQSTSPMFKHAKFVDDVYVMSPKRYEKDIKIAGIKGTFKGATGLLLLGTILQGGIHVYRWIKRKGQEKKKRRRA